MKKILLWTMLLLGVSLNAQFQDDFDDQTFPNDPDWFGDTDIYEVNGLNELQLMDTAAGGSFIYVPASTVDSTTWEFLFRLDFPPSTDNFLRIYLKSDSPDFDGDLNGYYLQIGLAGSSDSIELRRQDNSNSVLLLGGSMGGVATDPIVRIRVVRTNIGEWQLFSDYSGGTDFQLEGSINDATYNEGEYFGFKCKYGVTRKDKFFFDDITISPLVQDLSPPILLSANAMDQNTVILQFDEPLDEISAETIGNYNIDNGIVINNAILDTDPSIVNLNISNLSSGTEYTITTQNILDLNMNAMIFGESSFTYILIEPAAPFDILVNELFSKPDPEITNLPDAEFIELFNRSEKVINLEGFEIFDASNEKTLPEYILHPQSHLIICHENNIADYAPFGDVIGLSGLFSLNDSGDDVGLRDNNGIEIHKISYNSDTYQDEDKKGGGWSLELINPTLHCRGASNWRASINSPLGGTPGQVNSVFEDLPDSTPPQLLEVIAIDENQLRITFDEQMGASALDVLAYSIANSGEVLSAVKESEQIILLTINTPFFDDQENYTLTINDLVSDCSGNSIVEVAFDFTFYMTQEAERYDILINEFYPDISPSLGLPEKEFVELYNRSDKTINLEGFVFNNGNKNVELPFFLLQSEAYVLVYQGGGAGYNAFGDTIVVSSFIDLVNSGDEFSLLSPLGEFIHGIEYDLSWYQDAVKDDGGWSLELINPDAPCSFDTNWRASEDISGGTPGRQNSIFATQDDNVPLSLIRAFPESDNEVRLIFDKALDEDIATEVAHFNVEGLTIASSTLLPPYNVIILQFSEMMNPNQIYEVEISSSLIDCIGNEIGNSNTAKFAIPQEIEINDIIINEVLYDPVTDGDRFVELYNRSDKVFNIGQLHIADRDDGGVNIDNNIEVNTDYLIFPQEYIVLTSFPPNILEEYHVENPSRLIENTLPAFDTKEDAVIIFVPDILGPKIIDELKYTKDFHNALLDDEDGVSLERISFEGETSNPNNWQSAAETAGFGTPTALNSQHFTNEIQTDNIFDIPNTTFSPDGDGYKDFLLINYNTSSGGWLANIQIFDANGRQIKKLVQNTTLASEGTFKWEGDTENGNKARIGIYIIWIEVFKSNGEVQHIKKTCVVAGKLE